mmetsp:Transcript_7848/g.9734  ORF Transcript_7848/g.9734 Transcript_7848/m.9734 type:complete len:207 (-) Transcript_7848:36-656(-)|eukprot:CAMPEP_0206193644 /NCGR_PEP_ID=MMETSP0166-20121206/6694_1 /ASSEMBLY_ACC=CAM_ASM_000260 /TAXON_ID=95228 /ORGANISM="Vannella robusta, Strain DIVA3 518/3/11/1/6" /LENGTH=206 /DNA_ID=CAMNT_0053610405 /DNA_START=115 /DNA_END=735 /DNA_ORIENTATION=-
MFSLISDWMDIGVSGLGEVGGGALLIAILGGGAVGKSAITLRFITGTFVEEYDPTIEDCHRKTINVDNHPHMFDIIDTAGQEEYLYISDVYNKIANGFMFVFSVDNKSSLKDVHRFYNSVKECRNIETLPVVLVGNKNDLNREVSVQEAQEVADSLNCPYFDASAKNCSNIAPAFEKLASLVVEEEEKAKNVQGTTGKTKRFCNLL